MRDATPIIRRMCASVFMLVLAAGLAAVDPVRAQSVNDEETAQERDRAGAAADDSREEAPATADGVVLSPFDYEASESISEDASVSFPVDI